MEERKRAKEKTGVGALTAFDDDVVFVSISMFAFLHVECADVVLERLDCNRQKKSVTCLISALAFLFGSETICVIQKGILDS